MVTHPSMVLSSTASSLAWLGPRTRAGSVDLVNKCSIASRIDAFSDKSTTVFGSKLKEQVEDRLKFYETGGLLLYCYCTAIVLSEFMGPLSIGKIPIWFYCKAQPKPKLNYGGLV